MEEICRTAAKVYAGKNWHYLTREEEILVALLEKEGYILPNEPRNGFVGKAI